MTQIGSHAVPVDEAAYGKVTLREHLTERMNTYRKSAAELEDKLASAPAHMLDLTRAELHKLELFM